MKKMLVRLYKKAVGSRVKFTDGTVYETKPDGSIWRVTPMRPWRGKSERRQAIKARREDRAFAQANLKPAT